MGAKLPKAVQKITDDVDDTTVHPPRVEGTLYYEIDNWFGDDLITSLVVM